MDSTKSRKATEVQVVFICILIGLSVLFASKSSANDALDNKEVALVTHNWQNRPISWFSLNNIMGGECTRL